jgi:hypothetical protein
MYRKKVCHCLDSADVCTIEGAVDCISSCKFDSWISMVSKLPVRLFQRSEMKVILGGVLRVKGNSLSQSTV